MKKKIDGYEVEMREMPLTINHRATALFEYIGEPLSKAEAKKEEKRVRKIFSKHKK